MKPSPFLYFATYTSLWDDVKLRKLKRLIGCTELQAFAIVVSVYCLCARKETDGMLDNYSADDLYDACRWDTDAEKTYNALKEIGIIEANGYVHNFLEKQPITKARKYWIGWKKNKDCANIEQSLRKVGQSLRKDSSSLTITLDNNSTLKNKEKTIDEQTLHKPCTNFAQTLSNTEKTPSENIFDWTEYYGILRTELTKRKEAIINPGGIYAGKIIEYGKQFGMEKMKLIIPKYFEFLDSKKLAHDWGNANGFVMQIPHLVKSLETKPNTIDEGDELNCTKILRRIKNASK